MTTSRANTKVEGSDSLIPTSISVSGRVTEREQERAVASLEAALHGIAEPILRCTVRLEHETDPHHTRLATARLSVDVDGTPVHAHADATTVEAAIDIAALRLHERLRRRTDKRQQARRRDKHASGDSAPSPIPGGFGDEKHPPSRYFERPHDEREIERHISFAPRGSTIEEAIFDLEALGFEFMLFVEATTDDDAVVWRDPHANSSHTVRFAHGIGPEIEAPAHVRLDAQPFPTLDVDTARDLLDLGEVDYVVFCDVEGGRGQVLHRRYDGHLGLVTVAD
jgi:ribosome-associated translation inhibitor RaiA